MINKLVSATIIVVLGLALFGVGVSVLNDIEADETIDNTYTFTIEEVTQ